MSIYKLATGAQNQAEILNHLNKCLAKTREDTDWESKIDHIRVFSKGQELEIFFYCAAGRTLGGATRAFQMVVNGLTKGLKEHCVKFVGNDNRKSGQWNFYELVVVKHS